MYQGKRFLYFILEKPDANLWISLILKGSWWPLWRASLTQAHHVLFLRILFNQVIESASDRESYRINGLKWTITNSWWVVTLFPLSLFFWLSFTKEKFIEKEARHVLFAISNKNTLSWNVWKKLPLKPWEVLLFTAKSQKSLTFL